jgi:carbon-monoxide dehydrogenase medium subunit
MHLPRFEYHEPQSLVEACKLTAELRGKAKVLAGGTDLIVNMKKRVVLPKHVVSLSRIKDLKGFESGKKTLKIGACLTVSDLEASPEIRKTLGALRGAASVLGSPLIRNLATVGGNLVTARPAADLPPPLMAYGAKVVLKNGSGKRTVSLDEFFKAPGQSVMGPAEILVQILVDRPPVHSGAAYIKLGVRKSLEISLVNVASFIHLDRPDGVIRSARIVLGAVAPTPMRALSAEKLLLGEKPSEALFARAGEAAAKDCRAIDDFRGTAEYRRAMVAVFTKRTLATALKEAQRS